MFFQLRRIFHSERSMRSPANSDVVVLRSR
jgi:hypothetical protein